MTAMRRPRACLCSQQRLRPASLPDGHRGDGTVQVNGAAARLVSAGHKVIVASFGDYDEADLEQYDPIVVHVGEHNEIARVDSHPEVLLDSPLASEAEFT